MFRFAMLDVMPTPDTNTTTLIPTLEMRADKRIGVGPLPSVAIVRYGLAGSTMRDKLCGLDGRDSVNVPCWGRSNVREIMYHLPMAG